MYAATQPSQPEQEGAAESDEEEENEEPGPSQVCIILGSLSVAKKYVNRLPSQAAYMCAILSPAQGSTAENSWSHHLCLLLEADSKQTFGLSCFGFIIVFSCDVCPAEQKHARYSLQARAVCREEEPLADCKVANGHAMLTGAFLMEK